MARASHIQPVSTVLAGRGFLASSGSSSAPVASSNQDDTTAPAKSFGTFRGEIPCDPHRFRALFPILWAKFCRAHFRDAMHCAYSLGVTERTGRDWFDGKTGANGSAALYAVGTIPGAMDWIQREVRKTA